MQACAQRLLAAPGFRAAMGAPFVARSADSPTSVADAALYANTSLFVRRTGHGGKPAQIGISSARRVSVLDTERYAIFEAVLNVWRCAGLKRVLVVVHSNAIMRALAERVVSSMSDVHACCIDSHADLLLFAAEARAAFAPLSDLESLCASKNSSYETHRLTLALTTETSVLQLFAQGLMSMDTVDALFFEDIATANNQHPLVLLMEHFYNAAALVSARLPRVFAFMDWPTVSAREGLDARMGRKSKLAQISRVFHAFPLFYAQGSDAVADVNGEETWMDPATYPFPRSQSGFHVRAIQSADTLPDVLKSIGFGSVCVVSDDAVLRSACGNLMFVESTCSSHDATSFSSVDAVVLARWTPSIALAQALFDVAETVCVLYFVDDATVHLAAAELLLRHAVAGTASDVLASFADSGASGAVQDVAVPRRARRVRSARYLPEPDASTGFGGGLCKAAMYAGEIGRFHWRPSGSRGLVLPAVAPQLLMSVLSGIRTLCGHIESLGTITADSLDEDTRKRTGFGLQLRTLAVRRVDAEGTVLDVHRHFYVSVARLPDALARIVPLEMLDGGVAMGALCVSRGAARASVCIRILQTLHAAGIVDERLVPVAKRCVLGPSDGERPGDALFASISGDDAGAQDTVVASEILYKGALCDLFEGHQLSSVNSEEGTRDNRAYVAYAHALEYDYEAEAPVPNPSQEGLAESRLHALDADSLSSARACHTIGLVLGTPLPRGMLPTTIPVLPGHRICGRFVASPDSSNGRVVLSEDERGVLVEFQIFVHGTLNMRSVQGASQGEAADAAPDETPHMAYMVALFRRPPCPMRPHVSAIEQSVYEAGAVCRLMAAFERGQHGSTAEADYPTCGDESCACICGPWSLDWPAMRAAVDAHRFVRLSELREAYCAAGGERLFAFGARRAVLYAPHNGLFYRLHRWRTDVCPSATFGTSLRKVPEDLTQMSLGNEVGKMEDTEMKSTDVTCSDAVADNKTFSLKAEDTEKSAESTQRKAPRTFVGYMRDRYGLEMSGDADDPGMAEVRRLDNPMSSLAWWIGGSIHRGGSRSGKPGLGDAVSSAAADEDADGSSFAIGTPFAETGDAQPTAAVGTLMIAEFVRVIPLPMAVVRQLMLVPRIVWDVERQLAAVQFVRDRMPFVPCAHEVLLPWIVTALSAPMAAATDDYERLETLGDSLLKVLCTADVFSNAVLRGSLSGDASACRNVPLDDKNCAQSDDKGDCSSGTQAHNTLVEIADEGELSRARQRLVCNGSLYGVALEMLRLAPYARIAPFDARLWAPPDVAFSALRTSVRDGLAEKWPFGPQLFDGGVWRRCMRRVIDKRSCDRRVVYHLWPSGRSGDDVVIGSEHAHADNKDAVVAQSNPPWTRLERTSEHTSDGIQERFRADGSDALCAVRRAQQRKLALAESGGALHPSDALPDPELPPITVAGVAVPAKVLADIIEAVIGALHCACVPRLTHPLLAPVSSSDQCIDASRVGLNDECVHASDGASGTVVDAEDTTRAAAQMLHACGVLALDTAGLRSAAASVSVHLSAVARADSRYASADAVAWTTTGSEQVHVSGELASTVFAPILTTASDFDYAAMEAALGYRFRNRDLLWMAFSHSSAAMPPAGAPPGGECSCERLEWLGDALVDWVAMEHLWAQSTAATPADLSVARQMAVCNDTLASVAVGLGLHTHMRVASAELQRLIAVYVRGGASATGAGAIGAGTAPKALGDLFEAAAGAIFVDLGLDVCAASAVVRRLLLPWVSRHVDLSALPTDAMQDLWNDVRTASLRGRVMITFEVLEGSATEGHADASRLPVALSRERIAYCEQHVIRCTIAHDGVVLGMASGRSRMEARAAAARLASASIRARSW